MQALIEQHIPLSAAQRQRISQFCSCVLLAGSSQLSQLARWLSRDAKQDSREQWLRRLLNARYISQELVYEAWFKQAVKSYQAKRWHLVIDRTHLVPRQVDLVTVALAYRKRAIPIKWQQVQYGGDTIETYIDLIERVRPLISPDASIVFHGDAEFGAIPMLQYLKQHRWDFILGQRRHYSCRPLQETRWQALETFPMSKRQGLYLENVLLTRTHQLANINLFGFVHKGKKGQDEPRFYATSLPIAHTLRQMGRRRWGIECCFQDFKSSGWQIETSHLTNNDARDRLLVLLSICYLWATCLGRWLCKVGNRHLVDTSPTRQASLFRIGWDWLVYQFRQQQPVPHLLTLYS